MALISYLERYQDPKARTGSKARIWAELTSLGAQVRDHPLYSDARAVAREAMLRARDNVAILVERLNSLEYRFAEAQGAWVPSDAVLLSKLDTWEHNYGLLPLSIRTWYEIVGSVNFMGSHPTLNRYHGLDLPGWQPLNILADPLVIDRFSEQPESFYLNLPDNEGSEDITGSPYALELAPDVFMKANQSGGGPTEILFPNPAMDAPLISDDWDGVLFVNYLRICFEWGGFPGWRNQAEYPKKELDFLKADLHTI